MSVLDDITFSSLFRFELARWLIDIVLFGVAVVLVALIYLLAIYVSYRFQSRK